MFIKLCFWKTINSRFIMSLCKLMPYVRNKKKISLRIKVDILFLDFFFVSPLLLQNVKNDILTFLLWKVLYGIESKNIYSAIVFVYVICLKKYFIFTFFLYIYIYQIHVRNSEYISVTAAKHSRNMNRIRNKYVIAQHSCNSVRNALL